MRSNVENKITKKNQYDNMIVAKVKEMESISDSNIKYCSYCGSQMDENLKFCEKCGTQNDLN